MPLRLGFTCSFFGNKLLSGLCCTPRLKKAAPHCSVAASVGLPDRKLLFCSAVKLSLQTGKRQAKVNRLKRKQQPGWSEQEVTYSILSSAATICYTSSLRKSIAECKIGRVPCPLVLAKQKRQASRGSCLRPIAERTTAVPRVLPWHEIELMHRRQRT